MLAFLSLYLVLNFKDTNHWGDFLQRVLILGCSGSGKSTLSGRLSEILDIPLIHLDSLYWHEGWVETPENEWNATVKKLTEGDRWIIDGNYSSSLEMRLKRADTVILFDYPRYLCIWGAVKRFLKYRGKSRPDMAKGCGEKIDREFLSWIWNFNKNQFPKVKALLKDFDGELITLKNRRDFDNFLKTAAKKAVR